MNPLLTYRWDDWLRIAGLAFLYALLAKINLAFATILGTITLVWLPSGLALAALLIGGKKYWPGIFVGAGVANIMAGNTVLVSACIAIGNTLEPLLGAWLLTRDSRFDLSMRRYRDFLRLLFLAGIVSPGVSALNGVATLFTAGLLTQQMFPQSLVSWWMGDMLGIILATPTILVWRRLPQGKLLGRRSAELAALLAFSFFFGQIIFLDWFHELFDLYAEEFLMFIWIAWGALRFGRHGVLLLLCMTLVQALLGATFGVGHFGNDLVATGMVNFWIYFAELAMVGMTLATIIGEHKDTEDALRESEERFRSMFRKHSSVMLLIDPDSGRIEDANRAAANFYGYPEDALRTMTVYQINTMSKEGIAVELGRASLENRNHFVFAHRLATGDIRDVEVHSSPIEVQGRRLLFSIIHDITERKRAEDRERIRNQILELLAKGSPLPEMLDALVRGIEAESPAICCSILLLDNAGKHFLTGAAPSLPDFFNTAVAGLEIGVGRGSCGNAAATGQRTIVEDVQTHPYWADYKELAAKAGFASCWSEPIRNASGRVLGTFAIYRRAPGSPSENDIRLIEGAANLAGIAIERKYFEQELQLASLVYRNTGEGMAVTDAENRIVAINPAFTQITGYSSDDVIGKDPKMLASGRHDQAFYRAMWHELETTGHWQGEIWDRRKNGEVYAKWLTINTIRNKFGSVHRYVALFSDITEKKESEELIWKQANFDLLTGLPNRRMFRDRLEQEIKKAHRAGLALTLLLIDLDQFKEVNDTLGHDVGDLLLQEAAYRIGSCVRETDTVARLGGDEFTVILSQLSDAADAEAIAQKILTKLATPFQLGNEVAYVSASIGITLYPADANNVEQLLKNADQAMYVAKNQGRNRYSYFTVSMQEAAQRRLRLINDLRGALAGKQFKLHFQPIMDLSTGRIYKAEALLRWQHPTRGMVSPMEFIPLAEETGLIHEIGDWVFAESARWAKRWVDLCPDDFQVSVNMSPVQFRVEGNAYEVARLAHLRDLKLSGKNIVVEITEGLLLHADSGITDKLLKFRDAGIQVAIDDFGTGYSSLAYLKKFDIDYLKIDQSFVRNLSTDPNDVALSEAIIVMAHKLGLKVIAEGVETEDQRNVLVAAGCNYGQGYLFSRPVAPEEFEVLLKSDILKSQ